MENKRPTSVTVIAWVNIVSGISSIVSYAFIPGQITLGRLQIVLSIISGVIYYVVGIAMLKGLNWGRLLYLVLVPFVSVLYMILFKFHPAQVFGLVVYIIILVFLTRPKVSSFFKSDTVIELEFSKPSVILKKTTSVIILFIAECVLIPIIMVLIDFVLRGCNLAYWGNISIPGVCFIVLLTILLVLAGVALWDLKRWRIVSGVFLVVVSITLFFYASSTYIFPRILPQGKLPKLSINPMDLKSMIWSASISGVITLASGVFLIIRQKKLDKRAKVVASPKDSIIVRKEEDTNLV
jgi:hypothetical protein